MFKSIRNRLTALVLVGLVAAGSAGRLEAAGFALFEQGSKGNAVGGAFAATADDPSAMFFNPAGNAFVDRFTLEGGGFAILRPTARLDGQSPYPGDGYSASMSKSLYGIGHGYGVLPLSDSVKLSVGFWTPNGLGVPWENPDTFAGRFISQRVDLRQLAVSAQLAVQALGLDRDRSRPRVPLHGREARRERLRREPVHPARRGRRPRERRLRRNAGQGRLRRGPPRQALRAPAIRHLLPLAHGRRPRGPGDVRTDSHGERAVRRRRRAGASLRQGGPGPDDDPVPLRHDVRHRLRRHAEPDARSGRELHDVEGLRPDRPPDRRPSRHDPACTTGRTRGPFARA